MVDRKTALEFIKLYGTHFLTEAKMGARFQENIYLDSKLTETEKEDVRSKANSNAWGVSGGITSLSGDSGVEGSYDNEKESSSENEGASSTSRNSNYQVGGVRQFGQIAANG